MGDRDAIRCKHCGEPEVGKKGFLILKFDMTLLGNATREDFKEYFDMMERKARGEEITSENILSIDVDDVLYCFACDSCQ